MAPKPRVPVELKRGPFTIRDARRLGVTSAQLRGASWRRIGVGLYAWREIADAPLVRLIAARRRLPDSAMFSGRSAAWLHGLATDLCNPTEVTLPKTGHVTQLSGVAVRRSNVPPTETQAVRALRVTSAVQTVGDLACRHSIVESVELLDMVLHRRLVNLEQLRAWTRAHRGHRGIRHLRAAIELSEPAAESPMETRLRLLLVQAGLPRPKVQVSLRDDSGHFVARPDLYYPGARLVIEYDGATHRDSLAADNRRQNRLIDAGYRILRFTARDVLGTPAAVVSIVRRALAAPAPLSAGQLQDHHPARLSAV